MGTNTRSGIMVNPALEWKRFDALPPEIRAVYAAAPFDFAMRRAAVDRKASPDVRRWRRNTIEWMCDYLQAAARKTYGPDHPDAQRSRLEARREAAA